MATEGFGRRLALVNGRVYTADARGTRASAVGVVGERIAVVGTDEEVLRALPEAERIDLGGGTLLPGFIDAHNHFLATGESLGWLDVRYPGVASVEDLVAALAEAAARTPPGAWIRAFGFDHAKYEREPTRWDLDRATSEHPVAVLHVSGHHVLVNTRVLEAAGVDDDTPDPEGGRLVRDERGRVTGLCLDAACQLVQPVAVDIGSHGPNFHTEAPLPELVEAVERAGRAYLAAGLTTVCDAQVTARELGAYREARRLGRLPVRTVCMPLSHQLETYAEIGLAGPFGDDHLWIGPLKLYADGSLIGGTAAFTEPYGERGEFPGSLYHEPERLHELIVRAHALGWRVGVHTQGDRAMEIVVSAFEAAQREHPREDPRFRIEHAGYPTPEQLRRMAALGVITVNQPRYLYDSGDEFLRRLGERAHRLQPLREELELGMHVVVSSDSDVASYRPLDTIAAAVARRTLAGRPIGADQALTVEETIRAHTIEAAYAIGAEDRLGSIEPGKLADLVLLDGDLFAASPEGIADIPVRMTILDGRIAFSAEG
ncbi:MAG: amidohydrolase [Actinomycetota bacterium]|nr:MAG: amidohydrolase [Actinomycetota bacterium]